MSEEMRLPRELAEAVAATRFPASTDQRLQELMDRNNDGRLNATEHAELESLVSLSETLSLLRAKAYRILGRTPQ
jgi:hypothetical protein